MDLPFESNEKVFMNLFEQHVIVAVVHTNSDQDRTRDFECLAKRRADFVGGIDHVAIRTKCLGIFDDIDRAKVHTGVRLYLASS